MHTRKLIELIYVPIGGQFAENLYLIEICDSTDMVATIKRAGGGGLVG